MYPVAGELVNSNEARQCAGVLLIKILSTPQLMGGWRNLAAITVLGVMNFHYVLLPVRFVSRIAGQICLRAQLSFSPYRGFCFRTGCARNP
jgi:hypothetical protein